MTRFTLVFALLLTISVPALAQDQATTRQPKDPGQAQLMGAILAGAGHFYAEEPEAGLALLAVGAGSPIIGQAVVENGAEPVYATVEDENGDPILGNDGEPLRRKVGEEKDYTALYVGIGIGAAAWAYSILDADNAARRTNRSNGVSASLRPAAVPTSRSLRPGLAMRVTW